MKIEFWWRQIFEILIIHKPSLWSRDVPQKIWARSVQPFWRLLDTNRQTDRQTNKQTDKPNLYIEDMMLNRTAIAISNDSPNLTPLFLSPKCTIQILKVIDLQSWTDKTCTVLNGTNEYRIWNFFLKITKKT